MADTLVQCRDSNRNPYLVCDRSNVDTLGSREWFAAFTAPQSERAVVRHLDAHQLESFLPTFESTHVWKNRQKKKIIQPLFPCYVFVHVTRMERQFAFQVPGLLRLIGGAHGPIPIPSSEIDILRSDPFRGRLEPFTDLVLGERVRIRSGPMRGVEGTLIRKKSGLRFVLSINLINQHAALEIPAEDIEAVRP
jgi:transcription antitermination factor NusG